MSVRRRVTLAAALFCVTLPAVVAFAEGVSFYARNRSSGFISVGGQKRGYVLHVPRDRDPSRSVPLVISLHGAGLWGAAMRDISGWNNVADREGFIVAYPSGAGRASPRVWSPAPGPGVLRDVDFILRLVDTLVARYSVDRERVYVNGLSNGGGMAFALSCAAPRRIAAAGMVSSAQTFDWALCGKAPLVPAIFIHGTADTMTPYDGGKVWLSPRPFPSIPEWTALWAERNGCESTPRETALSATVTRRAYVGCAGAAEVVLYTLHGDGHVWPGGAGVPEWFVGRDSRSIDAATLMWEFFRERRSAP